MMHKQLVIAAVVAAAMGAQGALSGVPCLLNGDSCVDVATYADNKSPSLFPWLDKPVLDTPGSAPLFDKLTEDFIRKHIKEHVHELDMLTEVNDAAGLPPRTLIIMWYIESVGGTRAVCNKSNHCGNFQFGSYEAKRYKVDIGNLQSEALGTVSLLKHYAELSGYTPTDQLGWYRHHQQGWNGSTDVQLIHAGITKRLPQRIKRNLLNNIPTGAVPTKLSDKELVERYMQLYGAEFTRIDNIVRTYYK